MARAPAAFFKAAAIVTFGLFGTLAGSVGAVFLTPAGRGLAGRSLSERLDALVHGDIEVGAIGGPLWGALEIDRLVIRDTTGSPVLSAARVEISYAPFDLLAGRIVLNDIVLESPKILLEKRRNGKWNIATLFRGGSDTTQGPPPLIHFEQVTIRDGEIQLRQPWDPPDSLRAPAAARAALAAERQRPGRVIEAGDEGYRRLTTFTELDGRFPVLHLNSPDGGARRVVIDSLAVVVSDPAIKLRHASGTATLEGDLLTLALDRAALPGSELSAEGTVRLARGAPRFALEARAGQVALEDLRGLVPGLPAMNGRGNATITTRADGRLAAQLTQLELGGRLGRASGRLTAVAGAGRELAIEGLVLEVQQLDPDVFAGWVSGIPLEGRLDGRVVADGPLSSLIVDATLEYRDERVPGRPANALSAAGRIRLGGASGVVFDTLFIRDSDLHLGTVTVLVPSNPVVGRAALEGAVTGPWRAFTWRGTMLHRDGALPVSAARGTVFLDTRGALPVVEAEIGFMPLALGGLAGTWPDLPAQGNVRGTVRLSGTTERLAIDADLDGTPGHIAGRALVVSDATGRGIDSLDVRFDSLDLSAVAGPRFRSQLVGTAEGSYRADSAGTATGAVAIALGSGWVREIPIDSAAVVANADRSVITVDTAFVRWNGGKLEGAGIIGRDSATTGILRLAGESADLGVFDSLLTSLVPAPADTGLDVVPLGGRGGFTVTLAGALDSMVIDGHAEVNDLAWRRLRVTAGQVDLRLGAGSTGEVATTIEVDSARWEGWTLRGTTLGARGRRDSLEWSFAGGFGPTDTIVAAGGWAERDDSMMVRLDSLVAALTAHTWRLAHPVTAVGAGRGWRIDSLALLATDGSGELRVAGVVPGNEEGTLTLRALGIDLRDAMGLFQRDTVGILGRGAAEIVLSGTARAPFLRGTFSLSEGGYREFRAPYVQGALNYEARKLQAALFLWRTGKTALAVDAEVPYDLALTRVARRKLDGPLSVRATADSADLGLLEAFTKNLRRVRGWLNADVRLTGTWDNARLGGTLEAHQAAADIPGLGVRWDRVGARIRLAGDSVVVDTIFARGGDGTLGASGLARFERGRAPRIDMRVRTDRFRAMDVRNYLTLVTTSQVDIRGPLFGASLTGRASADEGALYFADLITKQVVDLDDPANADLIDTALVREARLGPSFQNRFVDSLRIDSLRLTVGEDFWLRSVDANVKLSGRATVNKFGRNYRLDGTLTAERGQYALKMGVITRSFEVERGTVRFLGTPDLNAELDLTARHRVKTSDGTPDMNLEARIEGTLLVPRLTLVNSDNPQMVETDMVSYLMFGRSAAGLQANSAQGAREAFEFNNAMNSYILPAFSSELERTLISDLGVPVDYIQIRAGGLGTSALESQSGLATVTAGWQVGSRTYVALNAGICNNVTEVSYRNFGASLEQRILREWRVTLSVEPVTTCSAAPGSVSFGTSTLYQLGLDLLWDREY
jgi:hypothetical protein